MAELGIPIVGQPTTGTQPEGVETSQSWDLHGGPSLRVASSVSEPGSGFFAGGGMRHFIDPQNNFGAHLQFQRETTDGSDYYNGTTQYRGLLTLSKGRQNEWLLNKRGRVALSTFSDQNLHLGLGVSDNGSGLSIGSDIFSQGLIWRPSGRFGFGGRLFAANHTFVPFDDNVKETDPLIGLVVGLDLRFFWDHTSTAPRSTDLNNWEIAYYFLSNAHRLGKTYATAQALPAEAQEYTNELIGITGNVTARLEDIPLINSAVILGNANAEGSDLQLQLKADTAAAVTAMTIGKGLLSLAALGLDTQDASHSMLAYGLSGLGELGHFGLARAFELGRASLTSKTGEERHAAARNFFLVRNAVNILPFAVGWALSDGRAGQAVLTSGQQLFLSTAGGADPAETGWVTQEAKHFAYEWNTTGGGFLGYRGRQQMAGTHLFSDVRLMAQAFPGGNSLQDGTDSVTGRDGAREAALAKTTATLGGLFDKELAEYAHFAVSGGLRTVLMHGGPKNVRAGVGAQGGFLFSFGKETRFEFGVDLAGDVVGREFMFGASPFMGIASTF